MQRRVEKLYDNLDFQRGVEVFLNSLQGASVVALRRGLREVALLMERSEFSIR